MKSKEGYTPYETLLLLTISTKYFCCQEGSVIYFHDSRIAYKNKPVYLPFFIDEIPVVYRE